MKPNISRSLKSLFISILTIIALVTLAMPAPKPVQAVSGVYSFNGMEITYSIIGGSFGAPVDSVSSYIFSNRRYTGSFTSSLLTVSGQMCIEGDGIIDSADVSASVSAGAEEDTFSTTLDAGSTMNCAEFSISVPVAAGVTSGSFSIGMNGMTFYDQKYGVSVSGTLTGSQTGDTPTVTSVPTTAIPTPSSTPTITPTPSPTNEPPTIEEVKSCISGPYYFEPLSLFDAPDNPYVTRVDWKKHEPSSVIFRLNKDDPIAEKANRHETSHTYSLQDDIDYAIPSTVNVLRVQAIGISKDENDEDVKVASEIVRKPIYGVKFPKWLLLEVDDMSVSIPSGPNIDFCLGQPMEASFISKFPNPALEATFVVPSLVPFLGGKELGIKETQASMELKLKGDGNGSAKLQGQSGFTAAGATIIGSVYGEGDMELDKCIALNNATLGLDIMGVIDQEEPVVKVFCKMFTSGVCPLKKIEQWYGIGRMVRWFNSAAKIKGIFGVGIGGGLNYKKTCDQEDLSWKSSFLKAGGNIETALIMTLINKKLDAQASGGGLYEVKIQTPDPDKPKGKYQNSVGVSLFAKITLTIWKVEKSYTTSTNWKLENPPSPAALADTNTTTTLITESDWQPISRDYAEHPGGYAVYQSQAHQTHSQLAMTTQPGLQEVPYERNIFPFSHPHIAAAPPSAATPSFCMVWVHDDTQKQPMQGEEIYSSISQDGTSWNRPLPITNDIYQDFAPQVGYAGLQNAFPVVVWEHNTTVQDEQSADINAEYINAFDIFSSYWNGSTWSTPMTVTENSVLDTTPLLAQGQDGSLLLTWQQNAGGELLGSQDAPDTFWYTHWMSATTSWYTPSILLSDAVGIIDTATAAASATQMAMVYSQDTDGDLETSTDREIFLTTWDGQTWSTPSQLTDDSIPDERPTIFYDSAGNWRIVWIKDTSLYARMGSQATPQAIISDGPFTLMGYEATQDRDGNMHVLWTDTSAEGHDIFAVSYDQAQQQWGKPRQMTQDAPLESGLATSTSNTGDLVLTYTKTQLDTETVTVSSTLSIDNVVTFGASDRYTAKRTAAPDLTIPAADFVLDPPNPAPGTTARIKLTLHNDGEQAVTNPEVAFYQKLPYGSNERITTVAIPNFVLTSGATVTVQANWTVPNGVTNEVTLQAIADPDAQVAEANEENNSASLTTVLPDLVVESFTVTYGDYTTALRQQTITFSVTIKNQGAIPSSPVNMTFYLDDPVDGTSLGNAGMETELAVGESQVSMQVWVARKIHAGDHTVYVVIDPGETQLDGNRANNTAKTTIRLLPDLALTSSGVTFTSQPDGQVEATIDVANRGMSNVSGAVVGLYAQDETARTLPITSTALVTTTVSVFAGGQQTVSLLLPEIAGDTFFIGVGLSGELRERNMSDNILILDSIPVKYWLYLPMVGR